MTDWPNLPEFLIEALGADALQDGDEDLLGQLALAVAVLPPEPLRARLLATVQSGEERYAPFWQRLSGLVDLTVDRVREVLRELEQPSRWEATPLPGMSLFHFEGGPRVAAADVGFVRLAAGTVFPEHVHLGDERVLVLEGGYRDSAGQEYGPGTLHEMSTGSSHSYQVLDDGPCLFAVVLQEGIEIDGQPFPPKSQG